MTEKLWCQMCGKTAAGDLSLLPRPTCPNCGAVLVEAPAKDGLLEEVLLAKLAKRDALIERMVEAGNWLEKLHARGPAAGEVEAARANWQVAVYKAKEAK